MTSDTAFSERNFDCWRAGKILSCQHCRNRPCKEFEHRSMDNVFMAKMNFKRDFALAREIILDYKFSFYAIFLT